jgi:hypothetical protein
MDHMSSFGVRGLEFLAFLGFLFTLFSMVFLEGQQLINAQHAQVTALLMMIFWRLVLIYQKIK